MSEETIRKLLEAAGKILVDRKQETQSGKCFNCIDICGVGTIETRHTDCMVAMQRKRQTKAGLSKNDFKNHLLISRKNENGMSKNP